MNDKQLADEFHKACMKVMKRLKDLKSKSRREIEERRRNIEMKLRKGGDYNGKQECCGEEVRSEEGCGEALQGQVQEIMHAIL